MTTYICTPYPRKSLVQSRAKTTTYKESPCTNNPESLHCACIIVKSDKPSIITCPSTTSLIRITTTTANHHLGSKKPRKKSRHQVFTMAPRNSRAGPGYARSLLNELSSAENRSVVTAVTMFAVRNPSSSLFICLSYAMRKRWERTGEETSKQRKNN